MAGLIEDDTDVEMGRYDEAYQIKTYSGLSPSNIRGGTVQYDPVRKVEAVYVDLPSGGKFRIGDRPVTPMQVAETDAAAAKKEEMLAPQPGATSTSPVPTNGRAPIESILGGEKGPELADYEAAGYTEAEVMQYEKFRTEQYMAQPNIADAVKLTPDQISQYAAQPDAEIIAPQAVTNRESFTDFLAGSGQSEASKFLSQVYEAIGLDSYESRRIAEAVMGNSNATRDIGIGLADLTPGGLFFGAEEGYNTFLQGYNAGDPMTAGLGALEAGLSVLEAAPLAGAGIKALRKSITPAMRQAIDTLKADAIGAGRAIAQGDTEMLGEVFQRGRPPQSLSAAAPLDVSRRDASNIFGEGSERVRYTDPQSGGTIEVVVRPDGSASVLELEVPETSRGQGIGQTLQERVMQDFPMMGGQVSSKAAATTAYRLGRRPPGKPDATLEEVFADIDEMSSVNMVSPAMQERLAVAPTPVDTSYRMQQQPRGPEDDLPIRLDDLTKSTTGENAGYPADFYSANGPRFYAPGPQFAGDEFGQANRESYKAIMAVRGKPDAEVTIYRAVPDDPKITTINRGDFVTLSPTYAKLHGGSGYGPKGEDAGKILSEKVKVKDIYFDGNDVNEFGYFPEEAAQGSVGKDILELNLKAQPRLAELFKNAEVTSDSSTDEIASTLLRAERSGIIDRRTADEILNGMKGQ